VQITGGLAKQLAHNQPSHPAINYIPEQSMMQAIAGTHDLGHPPFGHGGEVALNYCMRDYGGFEGNGQTLRILSKLEKFSGAAGSNLTRESLLGILKYPVPYSKVLNPAIIPAMLTGTSGTSILDRKVSKPPKCYLDCEQHIVDWMLSPLSSTDRDLLQSFDFKEGKHQSAKHKSFACSIMDLADDISYGVHDFEDALALRLARREQFEKVVTPEKCQGMLDYLNTNYQGKYGNDVYAGFADKLFGNGEDRKHQINRVLNYVIPSVEIIEAPGFDEPRLKYRAALPEPARLFVKALKDFIYESVIQSPGVQHLEFKGQSMAIAVFEVMKAEPDKFLPSDIYEKCRDEADLHRSICDYVAGMTDSYLLKTYERLFSPRMGSVFDRL
jgi:dGTPase